MAITKNRTISIRISENDYRSLKTQYSSLGTRSVSALARAALQSVIGTSPAGNLATEVQLIDTKLAELQSQVSQLSRTVSELKKRKI